MGGNLSKAFGLAAILLAAGRAGAATYAGNGATGFGGPVGTGSLSVTQSASDVTFTFNPSAAHPSGLDGNNLVIYLSTGTAGLADTSSLTATGSPPGSDAGNEAISGYNPTRPSRTLVTFAPGFQATYAFSFANDYDGLFKLNTDGTLTYLTGAPPTPAPAGSPDGTPPISTLTVPLATVGLTAGASFSFVATYLDGHAAYRSNETIGTATTNGLNLATQDNPAYDGAITFTLSNAFQTIAIPEPAMLIGAAGCAILVTRRRRPPAGVC